MNIASQCAFELNALRRDSQTTNPRLRNGNSGLVMKTFKDRIRSESVLIQLSGVRACRGIDPLSNFLVSSRDQTSHRVILLIYVIEQTARPGHLLDTLFLQEDI